MHQAAVAYFRTAGSKVGVPEERHLLQQRMRRVDHASQPPRLQRRGRVAARDRRMRDRDLGERASARHPHRAGRGDAGGDGLGCVGHHDLEAAPGLRGDLSLVDEFAPSIGVGVTRGSGDREPGWHGNSQSSHVAQVGALTAEQ